MARHSVFLAALPVLLALACSDATAPATESITIYPCEIPHWVAYQNDGGPWVVLGEGKGPFTFPATRTLAVARARFQGESSRLYVDYLTAQQAAALFNCDPASDLPSATGFISGSVAGLTNGQWARVAYGGIGRDVQTGGTAWTMDAQHVPATMTAARYDSVTNGDTIVANRFIIRRDRMYTPGAFIPLLDFDSDEAFTPQLHTVSYTGPRANTGVWFITGNGEHFLSSGSMGPATSGEIARTAIFASVPAARMAPGDYHVMNLSTGVPGSYRAAQHIFMQGGDRTLALGPELSTPVFTTVATTPVRRVRVDVPAQPEYDASIYVNMAQLTSTRSTQIELRVTREYLGSAPPVWSLTIPDLSGLAGMTPSGASLHPGEFGWSVSAGNRPFEPNAMNPVDGRTTLVASRQGTQP